MDRRRADANWQIGDEQGRVLSWDECLLAVLMDIRRELKAINTVLACPSLRGIPWSLTTIAKNTKRRRKRVRAGATS